LVELLEPKQYAIPVSLNTVFSSSGDGACCSGRSTKTTSAAESSSTANGRLKHGDHLDLRSVNPLKDELRNAVAFFDLEVDVAKVEQDDPSFATVVGVDNTCAGMDAVFNCEAGSRGNSPIWSTFVRHPILETQ